MKTLTDFSDNRHKAWCIHCGQGIGGLETNRDHVPSKSFLDDPYPSDLPVIEICQKCNTSFSTDEEYFAAFLGATLSGSTEANLQKTAAAARIFSRNKSLKERIDGRRRKYTTIGGEERIIWMPEMERIQNVVIKNARGHVYYELGQPAFGEPTSLMIQPLETMSPEDRSSFLRIDYGMGWPEIGSRMFTRLIAGQDMHDCWIVVQGGVYRFAVVEDSGFDVRIIMREYLAAQILWSH